MSTRRLQTNENTKDETDEKDAEASEVINLQKQDPQMTLSSSFKMEAWPIENDKSQSGRTKDVPKHSSNQHSICIETQIISGTQKCYMNVFIFK